MYNLRTTKSLTDPSSLPFIEIANLKYKLSSF